MSLGHVATWEFCPPSPETDGALYELRAHQPRARERSIHSCACADVGLSLVRCALMVGGRGALASGRAGRPVTKNRPSALLHSRCRVAIALETWAHSCNTASPKRCGLGSFARGFDERCCVSLVCLYSSWHTLVRQVSRPLRASQRAPWPGADVWSNRSWRFAESAFQCEAKRPLARCPFNVELVASSSVAALAV